MENGVRLVGYERWTLDQVPTKPFRLSKRKLIKNSFGIQEAE
jgi:hypothetical protein